MVSFFSFKNEQNETKSIWCLQVTNQKYRLNQFSVGTTLMKFHGRKSFLPVTPKKQVLKRCIAGIFWCCSSRYFATPLFSSVFLQQWFDEGRSSPTRPDSGVQPDSRCMKENLYTTKTLGGSMLHPQVFKKFMRWIRLTWFHQFCCKSRCGCTVFFVFLFRSLRCVLGVSFKRSSYQNPPTNSKRVVLECFLKNSGRESPWKRMNNWHSFHHYLFHSSRVSWIRQILDFREKASNSRKHPIPSKLYIQSTARILQVFFWSS